MKDVIPIVVLAVIVAAVAVTLVFAAYLLTRPYIILPLLALVAFVYWRHYKRSRV